MNTQASTTLDALIEALEKASWPSRQIDALIEVELRRFQAYAAGLNDQQRAHWKPVGTNGQVEEGGTRYHSPSYTFSIDEALTLVPNGAGIRINRYWLHDREAWSCVISTGGVPDDPARSFVSEDAFSAATSVCIAALRARAIAHEGGE